MQKKTTSKNGDTKSMSQQELKNLRRAQARHRIELLQEAKTLHDHLADFWDDSLSLPRREYATDMRLYPAELEKILGSQEQSLSGRVDDRALTRRPIASANLPRERVTPAQDALMTTQ